ncbi:MAG: hypothetical protein ACREIQ_00650, partial [Nitrospiria bacterium]
SNSDLDAVIGSPMFAGNSGGHGQASRNGIDPALFDRHSGGMIGGISSDPANIGSLPVSGFDAVIGSSPYMGSLDRGTVEAQGRAALARQKGLSNSEHISPIDMEQVGRRTQPDYGDAEGQLGSMIEGDLDAIISSSPYGQAQAGGVGIYDQLEQTHNRQFTEKSRRNGYRAEQQGDSEAQIANLSEGDLDAIIASSPYAGSVGSAEAAKRGGLYRDPRRAARDRNLNATYGHTPGQLGAMVEGIITSPVYGTGTVNYRNGIDPAYFDGQAEGQLGREAGETFWSAVRLILDQCFLALRPGGVSIWICKDFIRDGERIPFCDMWRRLCESLGFEHLETYLALQIKDRGTQTTIDGDMVNLTTEYKSFFRRNYEKKNPDQRIDWEAVICMRKPEAAIE